MPPSSVAAAAVPHNPNRGGAGADSDRPFVAKHPLFTYTTRVPLDQSAVAEGFPSPYAAEPDFTASPPLFYAHAHPVERCMEGHFTKYPAPSQPDILACPIVSDYTDPATGVRTRERRVICRNTAPWVFRRALGGADTVELVETSVFDPATRELRTSSENIAFARFVTAKEASRFIPHPLNPQWSPRTRIQLSDTLSAANTQRAERSSHAGRTTSASRSLFLDLRFSRSLLCCVVLCVGRGVCVCVLRTSFVQYGGIRCSSYLGPLKRPLEHFICNRMIKGGLEAADFLDDMLHTQSPFD